MILTWFLFVASADNAFLSRRHLISKGTANLTSPWTVLAHNTDTGRFCGGVVISTDLILTAAHCWQAYRGGSVYASINSLPKKDSDAATSRAQKSKVTEFVQHPEWEKSGCGVDNCPLDLLPFDIAIVKIDPPFNCDTGEVLAVDLPTGGIKDGQSARLSGFGYKGDKSKKVSGRLMTIANAKKETCIKGEFDVPAKNVIGGVESLICFSDKDNGGAPCQGDAGNGYVGTEGDSSRTVFAIASANDKASCESQKQFGAVQVAAHLEWIEKKRKELSPDPKGEKVCASKIPIPIIGITFAGIGVLFLVVASCIVLSERKNQDAQKSTLTQEMKKIKDIKGNAWQQAELPTVNTKPMARLQANPMKSFSSMLKTKAAASSTDLKAAPQAPKKAAAQAPTASKLALVNLDYQRQIDKQIKDGNNKKKRSAKK